MKKVFFLLAILASFFVANAQCHDTIFDRDPTYFYYRWYDEYGPEHHYVTWPGGPHLATCYTTWDKYFYTDTPLKVIGIAYSTADFPFSATSYPTIDTFPEHRVPEYVTLYEADSTGYHDLDSVTVPLDLVPTRYMMIPALRLPTSPQMVPQLDTFAIPIIEGYFRKPIMVEDSFYVGHSLNNMATLEGTMGVLMHRALFWTYLLPNPYEDRNVMPLYQSKQKTRYYGDSCVTIVNFHRSLDCIWPIFDTTGMGIIMPWDTVPCPDVTNFRVLDQTEDCAAVAWYDNPEHQSWELAYGPVGTPFDSCTIFTLTNSVKNICGLDSNLHYMAYVRGLCSHDRWSPWSDGLEFWMGMNDEPPADIPQTHLDRFVALQPNPASSQVQIVSSFGIRHLSVIDMRGTIVLDSPAQGIVSLLDISHLPKGHYIVLIETAAGTATKKLIRN